MRSSIFHTPIGANSVSEEELATDHTLAGSRVVVRALCPVMARGHSEKMGTRPMTKESCPWFPRSVWIIYFLETSDGAE